MQRLNNYLLRAHAFNTGAGRKANNCGLIFGNTSADMDSVVGAILMAWYYGELKPLKEGRFYSPVINIPRDQLHLRIEIVRHLE